MQSGVSAPSNAVTKLLHQIRGIFLSRKPTNFTFSCPEDIHNLSSQYWGMSSVSFLLSYKSSRVHLVRQQGYCKWCMSWSCPQSLLLQFPSLRADLIGLALTGATPVMIRFRDFKIFQFKKVPLQVLWCVLHSDGLLNSNRNLFVICVFRCRRIHHVGGGARRRFA